MTLAGVHGFMTVDAGVQVPSARLLSSCSLIGTESFTGESHSLADCVGF